MVDVSLFSTSLFHLFGLPSPNSADFKIEDRIISAVQWIKRAYLSSNDGGISKGYDLLRANWFPSYPETTGYTIPALLNVAQAFDDQELYSLAIGLAEYLINKTTPEGGVIYWDGEPYQTPIIFDTGQVIFGWLAAYDASKDDRYLSAAKKSGDWLVAVQDPSGSWKMHQHLGVEKVIDSRVSWALLELFKRTNCDRFCDAAYKNLNWVLQQQTSDGWFHRCAFKDGEDPFTHTIAYTAEGLLESGIILTENKFIEAARKTADALLVDQRKDGSLSGTYKSGWKMTSRSSCLTGTCQFAILWLRLYEITTDEIYLGAARKAISSVARTQNLDTKNHNIKGAIAGSYPIYGKYERFKYPNWAAKFFVDSLLHLYAAIQNTTTIRYVG